MYKNKMLLSLSIDAQSSSENRKTPLTIVLFILGLKLRMRDHYRSQKMALWLNLVPDLQSAAAASYGRNSAKKEVVSGMTSNCCYFMIWSILSVTEGNIIVINNLCKEVYLQCASLTRRTNPSTKLMK